MMPGCGDDALEGTAYLAPHEFGDRRHLRRQYSANDSGIVDFVGSRNGSKIGSSVTNDCYSDPENLPGSPRTLYPVPERKNGHVVLCTQFSYPMCTAPSKPTREDTRKAYEDMSQSQRNKDDQNLYTAIDDEIVLFQSSNPESKTDALSPAFSYRRQLSSRQASVDSAQAAGRENVLYQPPDFERRRYIKAEGKTRDISKKTCIHVFFYLLAVAAFVMAVVNLLSASRDTRYEKLREDYSSLKMQSERPRQSLSDFEKKFNAMMDSLKKANISLEVDFTEKKMSELISHSHDQLRENFKDLVLINMSQCAYDYRSVSISTSSDEYSTGEYNFNDRFLLRAFCTTKGGISASIEFKSSAPNTYKCTCRGKSGEAENRACIFHFWACPYL